MSEPFQPRTPPTICDPTAKPGVEQFRAYVLEHFGGGDAGIVRACNIGKPSDHHEGRAWDWAMTSDADTDSFFLWLLNNDSEMFRRAGLTYVIWNRKIFTSVTPSWQPYTGADPHTSHVHVSFGWPGARGETSFYTAPGPVPPVTPPPGGDAPVSIFPALLGVISGAAGVYGVVRFTRR